MSKWMSIESAPKDGTFFIGWLVCAGVGQPETMNRQPDGALRFTDGGLAVHVSHWMPEPEPPETSDADD